MLDAESGVTAEDKKIGGDMVEARSGCIVVVSTWDLVEERVRVAPFPFPFAGIKNMKSDKLKGAQGEKGEGDPSSFAPEEILKYLESIENPDQLSDLVSCALLPAPEQRQTILETVAVEPRLKHLIHFLMTDILRHRKNQGV